jgi:hypothetical protein
MAAKDTTTVRVRRPDSERLQALASQRHTTVIEVVHSAIDALERRDFQTGLNDEYRRLRENPELFAEYVAEREEWDALA